MSNLSYRQEKIQVKRKATPWRDFVMEICSRQPINIYRNKNILSRYPDNNRSWSIKMVKEYSYDHYIIDNSNATTFLNQLQSLFIDSEKMALPQWYENENCDFVDSAYWAKNSYLSFAIWMKAENIFYSLKCQTNVSDVYNSTSIYENSSTIFNSNIVTNSFAIFYSLNVHNSNNIWFSSNMIWCSECISCHDLENQSYCIKNEKYTKEEYIDMKNTILKNKKDFSQKYKNYNLKNFSSINCLWYWVIKSENAQSCYAISEVKNSKNTIMCAWWTGSEWSIWSESVYDCINSWNLINHFYGVVDSGTESSHLYCCFWLGRCNNMYYSMLSESCSFCLWCIGLKNKSYCILNKQYTKEERYTKVDEIFTQMEQDWQLWEFFPATMNPFYFNDTAAYLIDNSFTKEEVMAKWYLWRDEPIKVDIPEWAKVVKTTELDQYEWREDASSWTIVKDLTILSWDASTSAFTAWDLAAWRIRWIDPEILNVIIQDDQGNVYKIVKMEYDFLMKYGLPLPRKHRLDRMKENFKIQ